MIKSLLPLGLLAATSVLSSASHVFVTPVDATSSTSANDLWPASNLIQGPGVGFDAAAPHDKTSTGAAGNWVTAAPGGFPSDYIAVAGAPVIVFDLGADTAINTVHTWGYDNGNTNGVSEFSLRFATAAEGTGGFGSSITYNPLFSMVLDSTPMQTNDFEQVITARYVEFTALDNFFVAPGDGSGGELAGGDRVGLGEVSFGIPEPSSALLSLIGLAGIVLRRRRP